MLFNAGFVNEWRAAVQWVNIEKEHRIDSLSTRWHFTRPGLSNCFATIETEDEYVSRDKFMEMVQWANETLDKYETKPSEQANNSLSESTYSDRSSFGFQANGLNINQQQSTVFTAKIFREMMERLTGKRPPNI